MATASVTQRSEISDLEAATADGYTPFVHQDASGFHFWITSLAEVMAGNPTPGSMRGVFSLIHELSMAADALTLWEQVEAR